MTVSTLLAKIDNANLGSIRIIEIDENGEGHETVLISYTGSGLVDLLGKSCKTSYKMGQTWYIVL